MSTKILDMLAGLGEDEQLKQAAEKISHEPEMGGVSHQPATRSEVDSQMGTTGMDQRAVLHEKAMEQAGRELEARTWQDPRENLTSQATAAAGAQHVAPSDQGRNMRETKVSLPSKTAAAKGKAAKNVLHRIGDAAAKAGKNIQGWTEGKVTRTGEYDHWANKLRQKGLLIGDHVKKHKGKYIAGGTAAVAGGGYAAGRKTASLADYWELCNREDGEKIASETMSPATIAALDAQAQAGLLCGRAQALGQILEASGR